MEQRISLITLGVQDLARSTAFYERLGWQRKVKAAEGVAFFQCGGMALALYPLAALAADANLAALPAGSGMALAQNLRRRIDVDAVLDQAVAAGATLTKPAQATFWGGYAGYFQDPDGHLWEIACNPGFALNARGELQLPE